MTNSMQKNFTRAFSLIEMMIVIGIIAILAGLTLGISNSVLRGSEIRKTKDAITLLDTALQEWETEMGRSITFAGIGFQDVDWRFDIYDNGSIGDPSWNELEHDDMNSGLNQRAKDLWDFLNENEASKSILAKIHPDLIMIDGDRMRVVDAWQMPIGIVFPGQQYVGSLLAQNAEDEAGDLTVRDQAEDGLGSCINRRPYFVSAGPDGDWGYLFQLRCPFPDQAKDEFRIAAQDNIYSYEPFIVEEAR